MFAKDYALLALVHRIDCMGRPESLILLNYMYHIAWRIGLYIERLHEDTCNTTTLCYHNSYIP